LKNPAIGVEETVTPPTPQLTFASIIVPPLAREDSMALVIANTLLVDVSVTFRLTLNPNQILNATVTVGSRKQFSQFVSELFPTLQGGTSRPLVLAAATEGPVGIVALVLRANENALKVIPIASPVGPIFVPPLPLIPPPPTSSFNQPGGAIGIPLPQPGLVITPSPQSILVGGLGAMVFPEVAMGGGWVTEILIGNNSLEQQQIRIDFFGPLALVARSVANIAIPPGGVFSFSTDSPRQ
jgi:hypothetical protein